MIPSGPPAPGDRVTFSATAYCKGLTTASGVAVQTGIAAADPALLPVGSVIDIDAPDPKYSGIYTVMDTGPAVQGRLIDVYMWSCYEALDFGRMPIQLTVLRLGWNPKATTPGFFSASSSGRPRSRPGCRRVPSRRPFRGQLSSRRRPLGRLGRLGANEAIIEQAPN